MDTGWLGSVAGHVLDWLKKPTFNIGGGGEIFSALADMGSLAIKGVKSVIKGDFGRIWNFFKKDPVSAIATTVVVGGAAVVAVGLGCLVVSGGLAIGGMIGGALGLSGFVATLAGSGILAGVLGGLNYLLGNPIAACINWVVSGALAIYDFDFNVSDEDLDKQLEQSLTNIYGAAGTFAGYALADLVCGFLPAVGLVKLNLTTVKHAWEVLGEMDKQELLSGLAGFFQAVTNYANQVVFNYVFKNSRKALQAWAQDPNARKLLEAVHPGFSKTFQELGKTESHIHQDVTIESTHPGQTYLNSVSASVGFEQVKIRKEPFILREKVEHRIEQIKDPHKKAFVSNMYNAAFTSCTNQLICLSFVV